MSTWSSDLFNGSAASYDAWFDTPRGKTLFNAELACLGELTKGLAGPWLEIGVGNGRFSEALGVEVGLDPARGALELACRRGVRVVQAMGETLPFGDEVFGAVLVIVTICFCDEPEALLQEAARVTKPGGAVILGFVPAGSAWGKLYAAKGAAGHHYYSKATFFSLEQLTAFAANAGLRLERCASTLYQGPEVEHPEPEPPRAGCDETAGFVAALFRRE